MSRAKSRQNSDTCADCGAPDPTWTSVNRGIFLCVKCCCIHRDLGRHISQVKSLQSGNWSGSQLALVQALNNGGINNIWEHLLLENGSKLNKRKPSPKDPLELRADFIKAKHKHCVFAFRPNNEDGLLCVENELGKQLHASVRTNNLETSFRFLIQGADPNYFHDEKCTTPLHVAAKKNQILQTELLIIYGADPTFPDLHGKTPVDHAKQKGHKDLANRLVECQYEVTDKFTNYLCHRKPDHQSGVHFFIPQMGYKSEPASINKLRKLPNTTFEELTMDVYDEIDRREVEAIWLSSADSVKLNALPFLPVNPLLSSIRNQSRQKLGKFSSPELKTLVYDLLVDTQRRQIASERESKGLYTTKLRELSQISDDDPLYDSVASDDDYALVSGASEQDVNSAKDKPPDASKCADNDSSTSSKDESIDVELLTKKIQLSESTISDLKQEITNLKSLVEHLNTENYELRTRLTQTGSVSINSSVNGDSGCCSLDGFLLSQDQKMALSNGQVAAQGIDLRNMRKGQRPSSMYETREGLRTPNWQDLKNQIKQNEQSRGTTQSLYNSSQSQVILQCTEQITKGIQQLVQCIQGTGKENCIPCADKIRYAVTTLSANIPSENKGETVRHLLESVSQLQLTCTFLQNASKSGDVQQINVYLQKVRDWAYEIAKETKQIVTKYTH